MLTRQDNNNDMHISKGLAMKTKCSLIINIDISCAAKSETNSKRQCCLSCMQWQLFS